MKGRVLCTEDDKDSREMLVLFLQNAGYEVVCSVNAKHALDLLTGQRFDLLLLDNWMPDMNGIELTRAIREFDQLLPILFYSGAAETEKEALAAGAQGYLLKPIGIEELIEEIGKLVGSAKTSDCQN